MGYVEFPFTVSNGWFSGSCGITSFRLEELLGTKLRALYQRKKGRDLFDMHYAISNAAVDKEAVLRCFRRYMLFSVGYVPTVNQFDENMAVKLSMPEFLDDTVNYLRNGVEFDPVGSWAMLRSELIDGGLESQAV